MTYTDEESCKAAGVDPIKVEALAKRLARVAMDAERMGLLIFGGTEGGSLRTIYDIKGKGYTHDYIGRQIVVAVVSKGNWSGGDGGMIEIDGVMYGE